MNLREILMKLALSEDENHRHAGLLSDADLSEMSFEQRYYAVLYRLVELVKELRPEHNQGRMIAAEGKLDLYEYAKNAFMQGAEAMVWIVQDLPRDDVLTAIDHSEWDADCPCVEEFNRLFKVEVHDKLERLKKQFQKRADEALEGVGDMKTAWGIASQLKREFDSEIEKLEAEMRGDGHDEAIIMGKMEA